MTAADATLIAARLLLAAVFGLAGVAKLADRDGSRQAMVGLGLPERLARRGAVLLPLLELTVAATLVPAPLARWGGAGAAVLLGGFTIAVATSLARGRTPDCHCFGQLHSSPIGTGTVVRNIVLGAVAVLVVLDPAPPLGSATGGMSAALLGGIALLLGLAVLCSIQTWLLLNVMRQNGRLLLRLDAVESALATSGIAVVQEEAGLPVGASAPDFALVDLSGQTQTLRSLIGIGRPLLLVFTDPECRSCGALLPDFARWQSAGDLTMVMVTRGEEEAIRAEAVKQGLQRVLRQRDWEVSEAYRSLPTPSAVLIDEAGRIASAAVAGADAIRQLVESRPGIPLPAGHGGSNGHGHPNGHRGPSGLPIGQETPDLSLPDLDATVVNLADRRGREIVLLFWHPECGFCQQMLSELKEWERRRPRVDLLVVSSGSVEANRAMGLSSPVLLDDRGEAMRAFGANGTPMAVLIDPEGRVASDVAGGGPAVLGLIRSRNIPVQPVGAGRSRK